MYGFSDKAEALSVPAVLYLLYHELVLTTTTPASSRSSSFILL